MGSKSTITISRAQAVQKILELLHEASNETIADVLEDLNDEAPYGESLGHHNFRVED